VIRVLIVDDHAMVLADAEPAGAKGYVSKNGDSVALVTAVRAVAAGDVVWPSAGGSTGQ
jgi:DNA-binding NarL/FixJ family response regulator